MFSLFKKEIKLVCFDIDNTLSDYMTAETETEAYMAEILYNNIHRMQSRKQSGKKSVKNYSKHTTLSADSISKFTILQMLTDIKNSHVHKDLQPQKYSRELWFNELFEKMDTEMNLGVSINTLMSNSNKYEDEYWKYFNAHIKNYPNTVSTLIALKSKGLKLASLSDSDGKPGLKLERIKILGLAKYFDYIITSDDTRINKPGVENWNRLLSVTGVKAKNCMMVGDHPDVDLVNAKKLGFYTVWTKEGLALDMHHNYVDYEIKDIKELIGIVEKVNGK